MIRALLPIIHAGLILVIVITDFKARRIPRAWSIAALAIGALTAALSPYPGLNLLIGALMAAFGVYGFNARWWAGGDVFVLAYLGLSFGAAIGLPMTLGSLFLLTALLLHWLKWNETAPIGAIWGLGALLILAFPISPLPELTVFEGRLLPAHPVAPPAPTLSPLLTPLPTPDAELRSCAEQAAWAVAGVGLVDPALRQTQAEAAAETLRNLAVHCPELAHLSRWSAALARYAEGDVTALPLIRSLSAVNRSVLTQIAAVDAPPQPE